MIQNLIYCYQIGYTWNSLKILLNVCFTTFMYITKAQNSTLKFATQQFFTRVLFCIQKKVITIYLKTLTVASTSLVSILCHRHSHPCMPTFAIDTAYHVCQHLVILNSSSILCRLFANKYSFWFMVQSFNDVATSATTNVATVLTFSYTARIHKKAQNAVFFVLLDLWWFFPPTSCTQRKIQSTRPWS